MQNSCFYYSVPALQRIHQIHSCSVQLPVLRCSSLVSQNWLNTLEFGLHRAPYSFLCLVPLFLLLLRSCLRNLITDCRMSNVLSGDEKCSCTGLSAMLPCLFQGLSSYLWISLLLVPSNKCEGRVKIGSVLCCSKYYFLTGLRFWVLGS